jgi:glyoxylase-like metal-dependent hydrolase (beta-lactamase superfamily II)
MPIPTPFAVGRVNCYLVEDDPLTLVDTGPNSGTSLTTLENKLAEHGRRVEDLERIVLTHQHIDHIGLAQILADRSGAEVVSLDELAPWLAAYGTSMDEDDDFGEQLLHRHGVPDDIAVVLRSVTRGFRAWGAPATVTRTLTEGDVLEFADRTWHVHHRPGHSPSDTVFHDAERRLLVAGDHLIKHISSNPLVSRPLDGSTGGPRPQALVTYMQSLTATRDMDLALVLPGHGEAFGEHAALIDERFRMHERRARKIGGLIAERPHNAFEIAQALWGNVAVTQAFLTISEVLGHVDLLINDGSVVEREDDDGVVRFEPAA